MIRRVAAVVLALTLTPALVRAQEWVLLFLGQIAKDDALRSVAIALGHVDQRAVALFHAALRAERLGPVGVATHSFREPLT